MNLPQAKVQLEKIISLYKSISADGQVSALERDLMLGYIRQLYETFLDGQPSPVAAPIPERRQPEPVRTPEPVRAPEPAQTMQQPRVTVVVEPQPAPQPPAPPPPPPVIEKPRVVETPPPPPPPVVEKPRPAPVVEAPPPPRPTPPPVFTGASADILSLFDEVAGKELSDRLSNTPLADLTKAFSINDRLLTMNELFGGNKAAFDEAVKDINNASGFDAARAFIVDIATRNNWAANTDRQTVAKSFIKLVRRRFR
jgi:hypothetical protein